MKIKSHSTTLGMTLLAAFPMLQAQTLFDPYVSPVGQWTDRGLLFTAPGLPIRWVARGTVREVEPPKMHNPFSSGPLTGVFKSGMGGVAYFLDGRLWFSGWDGQREVLFEHKNNAWSEVAAVPSPDRKRRSHLVPLRNGRFLAFSPRDPELKPDQPSPWFFGVYAKDDSGELRLRTMETMSDKAWHKDPNLRRMLLGLQASVVVEDHFVLCCPEYGQFWVFSLEDGRLRRTMEIYGGKAAKLLAGRSVPRMVTQFQPQKDGTLLIAARDEAVLDAIPELARRAELANQQVLGGPLSGDQIGAAGRFVEMQYQEMLMQVPQQRWFELDPATGSVKRRNPSPVGALDLIPHVSPEAASKTFWMVDAEGKVSYTASDFSAFRKAEDGASRPRPPKAETDRR